MKICFVWSWRSNVIASCVNLHRFVFSVWPVLNLFTDSQHDYRVVLPRPHNTYTKKNNTVVSPMWPNWYRRHRTFYVVNTFPAVIYWIPICVTLFVNHALNQTIFMIIKSFYYITKQALNKYLRIVWIRCALNSLTNHLKNVYRVCFGHEFPTIVQRVTQKVVRQSIAIGVAEKHARFRS